MGKGGQGRGVKRVEPWWTALPEYVPPVAWPTLLPVGTVRASYDARRWRVSYGDGAQQARPPHPRRAATLCHPGCGPV